MSGNRVKPEDWRPRREDWVEFIDIAVQEVGFVMSYHEALFERSVPMRTALSLSRPRSGLLISTPTGST